MKISIKNFKCHSSLSIEFPKVGLCLLRGLNGQGKTTIFQACQWCLYGTLTKIAPFNAKSTTVTSVTIDFDTFKVFRKTNSKYLEVIVNHNIENSKSLQENKNSQVHLENEIAQSFINSNFGSEDFWLSACYNIQGFKNNFFEIDNTSKTAILTEITGLNESNSFIEGAKKEYKEGSKKHETTVSKFEILNKVVNNNMKRYDIDKEEIELLKNISKDELKEVVSQIEQMLKNKECLKKEEAELENNLKKITEIGDRIEEVRKGIQKFLFELAKIIKNFNISLHRYTSRYNVEIDGTTENTSPIKYNSTDNSTSVSTDINSDLYTNIYTNSNSSTVPTHTDTEDKNMIQNISTDQNILKMFEDKVAKLLKLEELRSEYLNYVKKIVELIPNTQFIREKVNSIINDRGEIEELLLCSKSISNLTSFFITNKLGELTYEKLNSILMDVEQAYNNGSGQTLLKVIMKMKNEQIYSIDLNTIIEDTEKIKDKISTINLYEEIIKRICQTKIIGETQEEIEKACVSINLAEAKKNIDMVFNAEDQSNLISDKDAHLYRTFEKCTLPQEHIQEIKIFVQSEIFKNYEKDNSLKIDSIKKNKNILLNKHKAHNLLIEKLKQLFGVEIDKKNILILEKCIKVIYVFCNMIELKIIDSIKLNENMYLFEMNNIVSSGKAIEFCSRNITPQQTYERIIELIQEVIDMSLAKYTGTCPNCNSHLCIINEKLKICSSDKLENNSIKELESLKQFIESNSEIFTFKNVSNAYKICINDDYSKFIKNYSCKQLYQILTNLPELDFNIEQKIKEIDKIYEASCLIDQYSKHIFNLNWKRDLEKYDNYMKVQASRKYMKNVFKNFENFDKVKFENLFDNIKELQQMYKNKIEFSIELNLYYEKYHQIIDCYSKTKGYKNIKDFIDSINHEVVQGVISYKEYINKMTIKDDILIVKRNNWLLSHQKCFNMIEMLKKKHLLRELIDKAFNKKSKLLEYINLIGEQIEININSVPISTDTNSSVDKIDQQTKANIDSNTNSISLESHVDTCNNSEIISIVFDQISSYEDLDNMMRENINNKDLLEKTLKEIDRKSLILKNDKDKIEKINVKIDSVKKNINSISKKDKRNNNIIDEVLPNIINKYSLEKRLNKTQSYLNISSEYEEMVKLENKVKNYSKTNIWNKELLDISLQVRKEMMNERMKYLNKICCNICERIFDYPVFFEVASEKELKNGNKKTEISVNVSLKGSPITTLKNCSGGEFERLSFAFTCSINSFSNFQYLFLDESILCIDEDAKEPCMDVIRSISKEKCVVMVWHGCIEGQFDHIINV